MLAELRCLANVALSVVGIPRWWYFFISNIPLKAVENA
jgi:hypothetical protein